MRKASAFLTSAILTLLMFGCGVQTKTSGPSIPYPTPRFDGLDGVSDATGSTETSSTPSPQPSASPQEASHRFLRTIGKGVLRAPSSIAAFNDYLLTCDDKHQDPIGNFSLAIRFGRDGNRQGDGYGPNGGRLSETSAVCTNGTIVYVADKVGVFGFYGSSERMLNGGKAYLSGKVKDMVMTSTGLTVLGEREISFYSLASVSPSVAIPSFLPLFPKVKATGVGLGIDKDGKVYLATSNSIVRYEEGKATATFSGFTDLRDVAADPRNGDLYALEGHKVLRLDAEGKTLESFGDFLDATSLSIDRDGCVYACDRGKATIQAFEPCSPLE